MQNKMWWQSKTVWLNVLTFLTILLADDKIAAVIPNRYVILILAALNLALRFISSGGVTVTAPKVVPLLLVIGVATGLSLLQGCTTMPDIIKASAKDSAIIIVDVGTPYGTGKFRRIGDANRDVKILPDGTVELIERYKPPVEPSMTLTGSASVTATGSVPVSVRSKP